MPNSLLTGVSGLRVHQQLLDVVGDNLANSNTTGFKGSRVRFSDLMYHTLRYGSAASSGLGGINPVQAGLGVYTSAIDINLTQGALESTGGNFDLAIQGDGFFVANDGKENRFTRAGTFMVDQENYFVQSGTGARVQRYGTIGEATATSPAFQVLGDNSIKIPFGTAIPGEATANIALQGNLSANAIGPLAQTVTSVQPFEAGGLPAGLATPLNSLDTNWVNYVAGDSLRLQGLTSAGAAVDVLVPLAPFFPPGPTMGNLITAINANFPDATASLDVNGNLLVQANSTGPSQLSVTIRDATPAPPQIGSTSWGTHSLSITTTGKDGDTVPAAIQVYDTQGTPHVLSLTFQKQATNTWDLTGSIAAADGTMTDSLVQGITFNEDGSFRAITGIGAGDGFMTTLFTGMTIPQTIAFSFGDVNGFNGLTQFGGQSTAVAREQDGMPAGVLTNVSVSADGILQGTFTNGKLLPLAQLAIATFANPWGLLRAGNNLFSQSSQSGEALITAAAAGGRGSVQQGVLEASNAEVALEFTRLIVAQRGFQANARTVSVSDAVLQELANIIR